MRAQISADVQTERGFKSWLGGGGRAMASIWIGIALQRDQSIERQCPSINACEAPSSGKGREKK